jgi:hypothetical protein
MNFLSKMIPDMRQSLGKILNSHIPDWDALSQQADEAMNGQAAIAKTSWDKTDSFRKPRKGMVHDIWKIENGICLKRKPYFLIKFGRSETAEWLCRGGDSL